MKYKSLLSLTVSLAIVGSGGFAPIPAIAEPDPTFKPILGEIRNKLPSNLVFRLPERLPGAITRAMSPQLRFDVNDDRAYLALEDKDCHLRFRRGSRGYALACLRFSVASSTLASKYYREDKQFRDRATAVQLSSNVRGYHFQGADWNTVLWVQDNNYFKIYSGTVRRDELIEVARSMVASSPILPSTETARQPATNRLPTTSQSPPSHPIQNLPNGDYFYGETSQANKIGQEYAFFRKSGNAITGIGYKRNTGYAYCFRGTVNSSVIPNATLIVHPDGEGGYQVIRNKSLNFSRFSRVMESDNQVVNIQQTLAECFQRFK